jgi:serine/threonine-protein kinase
LVLRRAVAIKRLREEIAMSEMLRREAVVSLDLAHEGIVRVHHFEPRHEVGGPFLVMEYIDWPSGEKWMAEAGATPLPTEAVLTVGERLCSALAFAHGRGVIHLDIKPSNIFVDPSAEQTKLADFGIASILRAGVPKAVSLQVVGTPAYMAPEQKVPGGVVSPATDVYQLAATLWDLLTGSPPGGAVHPAAQADRRRAAALGAVAAGLERDPARRPRGAAEFKVLLAQCTG